MKKILVVLFLLCPSILISQNLQLHYDLGEGRNYFTSTFSMFKPDEYGTTFWFIDMDFNQKGIKSISLVYFEIARAIKIPGFDWFMPTIQYNDGAAPWGRMGPVWLAGIQRRVELPGFAFNVDLLYRNSYLSDDVDFQITISWNEVYFEKLNFTGFFDIWTKETNNQIVILTEPQIWYKVFKHLLIGSEIEYSLNLLTLKGSYIKPTIACKWEF